MSKEEILKQYVYDIGKIHLARATPYLNAMQHYALQSQIELLQELKDISAIDNYAYNLITKDLQHQLDQLTKTKTT